jgi:hypothetical protein
VNFRILGLRTTGDTAIGDGLYPPPGDGPAGLARETLDGDDVRLLSASALRSSLARGVTDRLVEQERSAEWIKLKDIAAAVAVTDARVAVSCRDYRKFQWGPFYGPGLLVGANSAEDSPEAREERERQLKKRDRPLGESVLVGHVRYQWLRSVVYFSKPKGFYKFEELVLGIVDGSGEEPHSVILRISLSTGEGAARAGDVAREILRRASSFWLSREGISAAQPRCAHRPAVQRARACRGVQEGVVPVPAPVLPGGISRDRLVGIGNSRKAGTAPHGDEGSG